MQAATFLPDIAMVAGVAAITGGLARRFGQPSILGYLFAGLVVGPYIPVPLFADPHRIEALAEFGVVLVMFAVGLEFRVARMLKVLPLSGFTALVQVATLLWAGFTLGTALGWTPTGASFLGAALAISSTMVVTGLFAQQPVEADVREHVLGVLVVQDLVAICLMAAMTALAEGQAMAPAELARLVARLAAVLLGMMAAGILVVPRLVRAAEESGGKEGLAVLAMGLSFGFALLAEHMGYSAALGAFVAGMLVAESGRAEVVEHAIEPLRAVFAAIFFVSIGMSVDPAVAYENLPLSLGVGALVVVGQLVSVSVASVLSGSPVRRAVLSGLALGQIGELSFILAGIGVAAGVAPDALLPTLVTVATLTTFTTPLLLRRGDVLVGWVDHYTPPRLLQLLNLHQTWLRRLRAGESSGAVQWGALRALAVDWVALLVLAVAGLASKDAVAVGISENLGLEMQLARRVGQLIALTLALPLLIGLLRNARALAKSYARAALPSEGLAPRVRSLLEALAQLALVLGVGLPALALLRPFIPGAWGEPVLAGAVIVAAVIVRRRLQGVEGEFQSSAEALALRLAERGGVEEGNIEDPALMPGLDRVLALPLPEGAHAVGRTLAELNLRALTAATVVAIHKPDAEVLLPTGHERLEQGDVLALAGFPAGLERARALLLRGEREGTIA